MGLEREGGGAKASGAAATAAVARSRGSCNCCTKGRRGRAVLDEEEATSFRSGATQRGEQEVAAAAIRVVAMGARLGDLGVEVERHVAAQQREEGAHARTAVCRGATTCALIERVVGRDGALHHSAPVRGYRRI